LENLIQNLGEGLTPKEMEEFAGSIQYDENGKVSYRDFLKIVYNEK
jgi:Ca2+-binding EF-hand superfamily protein